MQLSPSLLPPNRRRCLNDGRRLRLHVSSFSCERLTLDDRRARVTPTRAPNCNTTNTIAFYFVRCMSPFRHVHSRSMTARLIGLKYSPTLRLHVHARVWQRSLKWSNSKNARLRTCTPPPQHTLKSCIVKVTLFCVLWVICAVSTVNPTPPPAGACLGEEFDR